MVSNSMFGAGRGCFLFSAARPALEIRKLLASGEAGVEDAA